MQIVFARICKKNLQHRKIIDSTKIIFKMKINLSRNNKYDFINYGKCVILFLEFMPNDPKFMPNVSDYYAKCVKTIMGNVFLGSDT